ncbi:hypothetical protein [Paenibacillus eucommiae]|uniref:Uncharacterized protein n=1 Tax=Paenibacillus eucommiae TaxID=1355755 RepID=A0ABS4J0V4_9BACL|nr:hypothetical protein [Paenibacillus eucommiae]MBP1993469.1 hypothetical protein [Paenibacillus eucommiae]
MNSLISEENYHKQSKKAADIYPFLEAYISRKEQQAAEIERVVERYEIKRLKEERAYQTMSPLRRVFSSKKSAHQLALEYMHHVKKPMEQVKRIRQEISHARWLLSESKPGDEMIIPIHMEALY